MGKVSRNQITVNSHVCHMLYMGYMYVNERMRVCVCVGVGRGQMHNVMELIFSSLYIRHFKVADLNHRLLSLLPLLPVHQPLMNL